MQFKLLFIALAMFITASCSQDNSASDISKELDVIELRFGHTRSTSSSEHEAAKYFASIVEKKSNGRIKIDVYPKSVLGSEREMIFKAQTGELDFIVPPTAELSYLTPEIQIFDIPYLFEDEEEAHDILDGIVGTLLIDKLNDQDLVGLAFWEAGFKQLTSNKKITDVDSLDDMSFRIMPSFILGEQFKAWGADTNNIDFARTYDALRSNTVDGQESPIVTISDMKFYEVQDYLYKSDHGYLVEVLAMSKKTYDKLNEKDKNIIISAAKKATYYQRNQHSEHEALTLEKLKKKNIAFKKLSDETEAHFKEKSSFLLEKYRMLFGSGVVERVLLEKDYTISDVESTVVVGLDADMFGVSALSGLAIRRGIELAIDEINADGGLLGKKVILKVRDNSMIPAKGLDNLEYFSQLKNLIAVFGGISSPVVLAEVDYIHEKKILFLDPWAAATTIIDNGYSPNYIFRLSVRDEYAAIAMINQALKKSDKIGLLLVNNAWGESNYRALTKKLKKEKLQATAIERFSWGEANFDEKLTALLEKGSRVVIYVGGPLEGAKFIRAIDDSQIKPSVISHWGITGTDFSKKIAGVNQVDLQVLQTFYFIGNKSASRLAERYHEKYHITRDSDIVAPVGTAHAYDLMHLLAKAVKKANSLNMSEIRDALEKINRHKGLIKQYQRPFSQTDHEALEASDYIFCRYTDAKLYPCEK